jgi:hypothetical protein
MKNTPVLALMTALCCRCSMAIAQTTQPFPDVPKGHWAYEAVMELKQKGILIGYPSRYPGAQASPPKAGSKTQENIPTASGNLAQIPTGVLLRLAGISHGTDKGQQWWGSDGHVFNGQVSVHGDFFETQKVNDKAHGLKPCVVVVAFDTTIKEDLGYTAHFLSYAAQIRSSDGKGWTAFRYSMTGSPTVWHGQRHSDFEVGFSVPEAITVGTLRVGVASTPWKQTATFKRQTGKIAMEFRDGATQFSLSKKPDGTVILTWEGDTMDMQRRLIILDQSGHTYPVDIDSRPTSAKPGMNGMEFDARLRFENIKEVRLQERPYEWIDFAGIPLEPR